MKKVTLLFKGSIGRGQFFISVIIFEFLFTIILNLVQIGLKYSMNLAKSYFNSNPTSFWEKRLLGTTWAYPVFQFNNSHLSQLQEGIYEA